MVMMYAGSGTTCNRRLRISLLTHTFHRHFSIAGSPVGRRFLQTHEVFPGVLCTALRFKMRCGLSHSWVARSPRPGTDGQWSVVLVGRSCSRWVANAFLRFLRYPSSLWALTCCHRAWCWWMSAIADCLYLARGNWWQAGYEKADRLSVGAHMGPLLTR